MATDEVATVRMLLACRSDIEVLVLRHGGRVVDTPGDNILAEFSGDADAALCAVHMQRALAERNSAQPTDRRMYFRIGVHSGDVLVEDGKVYGDVINVAARLESLAEPGGVRLSGAIADQVKSVLEMPLEDLGEHRLKNIPYLVRVLRVCELTSAKYNAMHVRNVPGFGGRPALAVLPFTDVDGQSDFLVRGMAEELNVRLASFRALPIVAHESTLAWRERAEDFRSLGEDLGVAYAVSATVQRAKQSVRVHARMVDTATGTQAWAAHYDHPLSEVFEVQDAIAREIVAAVEPELRRAESTRVMRRDPQVLSAWECVQSGQWHLSRMTRDDNALALTLFVRACELDPSYAAARGSLALAQLFCALYAWSDSPREMLRAALKSAEDATEIDDLDPFVHRALGGVCGFLGQLARAIAENERAVELNPSYALGHWGVGQWLPFLGRPKDAIATLSTAIRLSPRDPLLDQFQGDLALAYFGAGLYGDAVTNAHRSLSSKRQGSRAWPILIAALSHLDLKEDAATACREMRAESPGFTVDGYAKILRKIGTHESLLKALLEGLSRAGLH